MEKKIFSQEHLLVPGLHLPADDKVHVPQVRLKRGDREARRHVHPPLEYR